MLLLSLNDRYIVGWSDRMLIRAPQTVMRLLVVASATTTASYAIIRNQWRSKLWRFIS